MGDQSIKKWGDELTKTPNGFSQNVDFNDDKSPIRSSIKSGLKSKVDREVKMQPMNVKSEQDLDDFLLRGQKTLSPDPTQKFKFISPSPTRK